MWRVPTRNKRVGDAPRARTCAKKHLLRELEILHPRLVLTYDKDAANFFVEEATARGVSVVRNNCSWPSVVGWSSPHGAWGWPLGLLAVTGKHDKSHAEIAFIRDKGTELLAQCKRLETSAHGRAAAGRLVPRGD